MSKDEGLSQASCSSTKAGLQEKVSEDRGSVDAMHHGKNKADFSVQGPVQGLTKRPRLDAVQVAVEPTDPLATNAGRLEGKQGYFQDEMSLREWLCSQDRMINRLANLHIFRQVLHYVDLAHSQGVILRNIRPSCLVLSSLHHVAFIDSSSSRSSSERSSERSTGRASSACAVTDRRKAVEIRAGNLEQRLVAAEQRASPFMIQSRSSSKHVSAGLDRRGSITTSGTNQEMERGCHGMKQISSRQWKGCSASSEPEQLAQRLAGPAADEAVCTVGASSSKAEPNDEEEKTISSSRDFSDDSSQSVRDQFPLRRALLMEQTLYTSPEELATGTSSFAADIYGLGVLFFELFCSFSLDSEWSRTMSDLRHRVLPPRFLSGHPKEAALCLWLLHPEPSSRPAAKELLQCELLNEVGDALAERQAAADLEERSSEVDLLLGFLLRLQHLKKATAKKLSTDVACLTADIKEVENRRSSLQQRATHNKRQFEEILNFYETQERYSVTGAEEFSRWHDKARSKSAWLMSNFNQLEKVYFAMRWQIDSPGLERETASSGRQDHDLDASVRREDQEEALSRRVSSDFPACLQEGAAPICLRDNDTTDHLGYFFDSLCKYARYSQFKVKACLRHGELLNQGNMVCSLSFDRDAEFFATAGVCKKIKIFECDAVLNEHVDIHYPVVEMTCRSKISSVCWNSYIKSYVASSDYEGVVQLWDTTMSQTLMEYKEHKKRVWSVDFSHADPTKLASGSDDFSVKLWSINQETSIGTIKTAANICCVQFPANSPHLLACGSADYKVYCYDLRNTKDPICVLGGHKKAVSYVRFVNPTTILSASTDNTLKLWNLDEAIQKLCWAFSCG
ncbi:hypothetical protein O6H91_02G124600 [Diphasiastrum complanatum]|uniref:Uncharacterized protein n=1 Tax=Diphasiastrum complanatum TaxID=34168 RepID=A0ACC2EKD0_DIPCM|nr:hypothetical protein O6H91_02G124600 [Diphasiastrum complanatum]